MNMNRVNDNDVMCLKSIISTEMNTNRWAWRGDRWQARWQNNMLCVGLYGLCKKIHKIRLKYFQNYAQPNNMPCKFAKCTFKIHRTCHVHTKCTELLPASQRRSLLLFTRVWACCGYFLSHQLFEQCHTVIDNEMLQFHQAQTVLRHSSQSC